HRVALLRPRERGREATRGALDVQVRLGRLQAGGELGRDVNRAPLTAGLGSADEGQTPEHRRPEERRDTLRLWIGFHGERCSQTSTPARAAGWRGYGDRLVKSDPSRAEQKKPRGPLRAPSAFLSRSRRHGL